MSLALKCLTFMILLSALFSAYAQTISAASCSSTDVQNALNSVSADGTTVNIPAGNCTWTNKVTYNQVFSTIIQGQTSCTGTPTSACTDNTLITGGTLLSIVTAAGKSFRLTGMSFTTSADTGIGLYGDSQQVRIDHSHIRETSNVITMRVDGWIYGVMDHVIFDLPAGGTSNGVQIAHSHWNNDKFNAGDASWADSSYFGSNKFFFIEDSTFNNGAANDCTSGGRYVFRYNRFNTTAPAPTIQTHPTGGGQRHRGCRALEIYGNVLNPVSANYIDTAIWISSGTGLVWGNSTSSSTAGGGTGYRNFIKALEMRADNTTYGQTAPPYGWGYCQGATAWDQNSNSSGYPCLDQVGRGRGNLIPEADFPINASWPSQSLEPIYEWQNAFSPTPSNPAAIFAVAQPTQIVANRDYYLGDNDFGVPITFTGATGVGKGLLSARPSACTHNPLGGGVGYWATDTTTLYQCSATNTWTAYYRPYPYPHPLTQGSAGGGTAPNAPSGIQAVVN